MSIAFINAAWNAECDSAAQKLVLVALADHADIDGYCFPSTGRVAERTGISDRQVQRHIDALVEKGLMHKVHRRRRANGSLGTWLYQLHHTTPVTPGQPHDTDDQPYTTPVTPGPHDTDVVTEPSCTEPSLEPSSLVVASQTTSHPAVGDSFDNFYAEYPKKQGKETARKKWAKMSVTERTQAFAALPAWQRYAELHPQGNTFVPMASTFLNQRRWEDDPPSAAGSTAPTRVERTRSAADRFLDRHNQTALPRKASNE